MGTSITDDEATWVALIQVHKITPTIGKLNRSWIDKQSEQALEDVDDMGGEARRSIRQAYDNRILIIPRDVCAFLYMLMREWEERLPKQGEVFMYLTLANAFPISVKRFSHFTIIENLEQIYQYMVDKGYENVPGVRALSTSRERRLLLQKSVRRFIREHPEEVRNIEPAEKKSLLEERLEKPLW